MLHQLIVFFHDVVVQFLDVRQLFLPLKILLHQKLFLNH